MPGGVAKTFVPVREPALKDAFDEWLARVVCYAFSLPPTAFTAQVNRATAETAQDVSLSEGLAPLQGWVKHLIDRVLAEEFGAADLEFAWDADRDADPAQTATIAADYVKAGIKSINEVRAELGLPPVAGGEQPKIQTAQGLVPLTQSAAPPPSPPPAAKAETLRRYNDNHYGPGERGGQFAPAGEGSGGGTQVAQDGGDTSDETGRGREDLESEFVDQGAPLRQTAYANAREKLSYIDPTNPALPSAHTRDWTPSQDDVSNMQGALDHAIENVASDAAEHAYDKHVTEQGEFPEIGSQIELQTLAQNVMQTERAQIAPNGQAVFYQAKSNTLVIVNSAAPEQSTIFRPPSGQDYVDRILKQSR